MRLSSLPLSSVTSRTLTLDDFAFVSRDSRCVFPLSGSFYLLTIGQPLGGRIADVFEPIADPRCAR